MTDAAVTLTYEIVTLAVAIQSYLEVASALAPVLGDEWSGAVVRAVDADGDALAADGGQAVAVTLEAPGREFAVTCESTWSADKMAYAISCVMPKVTVAGAWTLTATLDGEAFSPGGHRMRVCGIGRRRRDAAAVASIVGAL